MDNQKGKKHVDASLQRVLPCKGKVNQKGKKHVDAS